MPPGPIGLPIIGSITRRGRSFTDAANNPPRNERRCSAAHRPRCTAFDNRSGSAMVVHGMLEFIRECVRKHEPVDIGKLAFAVALNQMSNTCLSQNVTTYESDDIGGFKTAVKTLMEVDGKFNIADIFPVLNWIAKYDDKQRAVSRGSISHDNEAYFSLLYIIKTLLVIARFLFYVGKSRFDWSNLEFLKIQICTEKTRKYVIVPDLAYAVSRLSRYTSNPSYAHWKAITRVLHYLRYSRDYGLHYDRHPAVIEGYSDANWISDIKDSRSTSGYVFTLGGAAISWKSSKQTVIAKSTMESEFIALDKCGEEAEWLRQFVEDIPRWPKPVTAISIHCDSKSAMGRAKSTMYNGKSRHIRRRHNSIRQLLSTGVISIDYVASKDNIADPFTKGLSRELVSKSSKGMGLKPLKE
ncbi:zinc finger, CCHC-type containing protein [Tanacetum coccineum]